MNTKLFKIYMIKNNDTQKSLAEALGLPQSAVNARINGKTQFRQDEINIIRVRWNLSDKETVDIFFAYKVSEKDTIEKGA